MCQIGERQQGAASALSLHCQLLVSQCVKELKHQSKGINGGGSTRRFSKQDYKDSSMFDFQNKVQECCRLM